MKIFHMPFNSSYSTWQRRVFQSEKVYHIAESALSMGHPGLTQPPQRWHLQAYSKDLVIAIATDF
jgi:hypothetical protein